MKTSNAPLSFESECLSMGMYPIKTTKKAKQEWIDTHELWIGHVNNSLRVLFPVVTSKTKKLVWADAITGTLYDTMGRCLSSDTRKLFIKTLERAQEHATSILFNTETAEGGV